ncbi:MAG: hypothetical protein E6736_13480 [Leclercia adecarboxylata]|nr:hypothetical protein [Leclercia adecarboxylata]
MTEFTKEQLVELTREDVEFWRERDELIPSWQTALRLRQAEITLAALTDGTEQEAVYQVRHGDQWRDLDKVQYNDHVNLGAEGLRIVYAAPQLPQPAMMTPNYSRFLSDVMTAAGLLSHGKRDKGLATRLADFCVAERMGMDAPCRTAMLTESHRDLSYPVDPQVAEYEKIMQQALPANSFTDQELEGMAHGDNPQANAYRELLAFRRGTPALTAGWVSVPVEPTAEMQSAAAGAIRFDTPPINKLWTGNAVYKAMLAAAPDFRESAETSTRCPKCSGRGSYHCHMMLGTVECECTLPAGPQKETN